VSAHSIWVNEASISAGARQAAHRYAPAALAKIIAVVSVGQITEENSGCRNRPSDLPAEARMAKRLCRVRASETASWIRGAPQTKFPRAIRATRLRTSLETLGRPPRQGATRSISPKRRPALTAPTQDCIRLNDHQAFAPTSPPARQQNPKQSINATEAWAPGSATLQHGNLMAQRDRFQPQRGEGPGFASGYRHRSA
jgi:hypothetical protein